jgi:hypothetical protein
MLAEMDWTGASGTAVFTMAGLVVASLGGFLAARDKDGRIERLPALMAVAGLLVGLGGVWNQYGAATQSANDAKKQMGLANDANEQLKELQDQVKKSSINVEELSALDQLSPNARFYVQLSVNPTRDLACSTARKINGIFPGSLHSGGVRVLNTGKGSQPFVLVFGDNLTLAGVETYQQLAMAHSLANGLPPIRVQSGNEVAVDCGTAAAPS